jgi:hypothetical protein
VLCVASCGRCSTCSRLPLALLYRMHPQLLPCTVVVCLGVVWDGRGLGKGEVWGGKRCCSCRSAACAAVWQ